RPRQAVATADVIDSVTKFSTDVIFLLLSWTLVAWFLFVVFRRALNLVSSLVIKERNYLWPLLSIICQQPHHKNSQSSLRILNLFFVISIFMVRQYYEGNFSTDLAIQSNQRVIDNMNDLLEEDRYVIFLAGDTTRYRF